MSTAFTVLAFTVVLAEMFAAVGLSTVIPAAFVELCRAAKKFLLLQQADRTADKQAFFDLIAPIIMKGLKAIPGLPAQPDDSADKQTKKNYDDTMKQITNTILGLLTESDKLQLLVPKAATIDASFECGGSESYGLTAGGEGVIQVVGVKAGFSEMFELHSSTSLKLHVEFGPVEYNI